MGRGTELKSNIKVLTRRQKVSDSSNIFHLCGSSSPVTTLLKQLLRGACETSLLRDDQFAFKHVDYYLKRRLELILSEGVELQRFAWILEQNVIALVRDASNKADAACIYVAVTFTWQAEVLSSRHTHVSNSPMDFLKD